MTTTAIVPARNEARSVASVVHAALASPLVDDVVVVDGASTDGTGRLAAEAGARVVSAEGPGKGEAMLAGLAATDADVLVFLDGDLTGLRTYHVDRLVRTVRSGQAVMACGLFDRGAALNRLWLHVPPILTGERALRRELLASLDVDDVAGYRVEAALNCRASDVGGPIAAFVCDGMFHATKEEKLGDPLRGLVAKLRMFATAYWTFPRYRLRHGRRVRASGERGAWRRGGGPAGTAGPGTVAAHGASSTSPRRSVVTHSGSSDGADKGTPSSPSSSQASRARPPSQASS